MRRSVWAALGFAFVAAGFEASATSGIETRQVRFAAGATSATTNGSIKGDKTIDYKLRAKAGQTMSVSLKTKHGANYFNVLPPGSKDVAVYTSSSGGNEWTGTLEADGEYTVRVYLMRSAARRNETANYTLTVGITGAPAGAGKGGAAGAVGDPVERAAKGKFNATGAVPCAQRRGQPMGQCPFGVARAGGGTAAVVVTHADGHKRMILFDKGKATGADLSQADGNTVFRAIVEAGLYRIEAGDERYEFPEAVIFGG